MRCCLQFVVLLITAASVATAQQAEPALASPFKVKYVDVKTVFLDAGKSAGLAPGMMLTVKRSRVVSNYSGDGQVKANLIVAKLTVVSVSNNSAMCEVRSQSGDVRRGDLAFLETEQRRPDPSLTEAHTPVFKPALSEIDSEHEKRTPSSAVVANMPAQPSAAPVVTKPAAAATTMTIADAARANRNQPLRADTPSPAPVQTVANNATLSTSPVTQTTQASPAPATATPPAASPSQSAASTEPLSLGEIARRNRDKTLTSSAAKQTVATAAASAAPPAATTSTAGSVPAHSDMRTASTRTGDAATVPTKTQVAVKAAPSAVTPSPSKPVEPPAQKTVAEVKPPEPLPAKPYAMSKPAEASPAVKPETTVAQAIPATKTETDTRLAAPPIVTATPAPNGAVKGPQAPRVVASAARPASPEIAPPTPAGSVAPSAAPMHTSAEPVKVDFKVKYVAEDAIYIEGGKNAGLEEGMTLTISHVDASTTAPQTVGEVTVVSVSNSSAVCEVKDKTADIQRGDIALLSQNDQQKIVDARTLAPNRKYPQVIAFSEGDPLDEEARETVPKPPSPEVNRARGRIGADYSFINTRGAGANTTTMQTGGVVRVDMSRIGGSYWNLNGYWRGRLNLSSSSAQPQSVYDLVNRTYTIGLTYLNPNSHWTAGVGRLYLPWATSLDTLDGGYLGFKIGKHTTLGAFAGTTPDPASFDYNQDRREAGTFVAFEGGSFDHLRFTSAEGVAVSAIEWREDRQFVFSENGLFYKRIVSIYHSAQADIQRLPTGGTTEGLSRSFATLRLQPFSRFSIDVNHNYFRDVPTFDPSLVGTGLLDKFLFQGVSVGGRLDLPGHISIYNNLGQSNSSADAHSSLNQLYGITLGRMWFTGLRGDIRYSKFNSSFGQGNYRAASLSRNFSELVRIEVNAGQQVFVSSLGVPTNYRLLGSTVDVNLGGHYFIESAFNLQRSATQNFDQFLTTFGYRFDTGRHTR